MAERRTVADLRCHGKELLELCCRTGEPVFLSGGEGEEGVLLSRAAYEARGEGDAAPCGGPAPGPGGPAGAVFRRGPAAAGVRRSPPAAPPPGLSRRQTCVTAGLPSALCGPQDGSALGGERENFVLRRSRRLCIMTLCAEFFHLTAPLILFTFIDSEELKPCRPALP